MDRNGDRSARRQVYIVADGSPVTRRAICEAAVGSKHFAGQAMPNFEVLGTRFPTPNGPKWVRKRRFRML